MASGNPDRSGPGAAGRKEQPARRENPRIGGYELINVIAKGAHGTVYKAKQLSVDRIVALKILDQTAPMDPKAAKRFLQSARMTARLNHPNIVRGIDCGVISGRCYLVMEYVEGVQLSKILEKRSKLKEETVILLATQVARALSHAHSMGIIHRDIKPENILVTSDGVAKLADMGLAKSVEPEVDGAPVMQEATPIDDHLFTVGTPAYTSPEQVRGGKELDTRSDMYSLGIMMFQMLTGNLPFKGNAVETLAAHITKPLPSVRESAPEVSELTEMIVHKMAAKDPEKRYQAPSELLSDLTMAIAQIRGYKLIEKSGAGAVAGKAILPSDRVRQKKLDEVRASGAVAGGKGKSFSTIAEMPAVQPISGLHSPISDLDAGKRDREITDIFNAAAKPVGDRLFITVFQGSSNPKKLALTENEEIAIGRDATQAEMVIDDNMVSRRHCVLTKMGSRVLVRDCGSLNGTYVNDNRIEIGSLVDVGGKIKIGHTVFEVRTA
ncbi:MAG TPA: FHA domain-containing serine/threonine-protein kinase [Candidatus Brocadiia bacterium]|nr:FHA domain-containing serine/threonine-protein kinase [Candidatus Brocadiia bacterium]